MSNTKPAKAFPSVTSLLLAIASFAILGLKSMVAGGIPADQNRFRALSRLITIIGLKPFAGMGLKSVLGKATVLFKCTDSYYTAQTGRWSALAVADKVELHADDSSFCAILAAHTQETPVDERIYLVDVIDMACKEYPSYFTADLKKQLATASIHGYDSDSKKTVTQWLMEHGVGVDHHKAFLDSLKRLGVVDITCVDNHQVLETNDLTDAVAEASA